jgi:biopolymer transport protein ExbD/biopolymer transport protein TolR
MAMGVSARKGGAASAINVTPMIDVLLVLLIIFMVVQQGLQKGLSVQVPPPKDAETPRPPAQTDQIVLEVFAGGRYAINTQPVGGEGLESAVARVFANRPRKVLFVKGGAGLTYGEVAAAVDASRAAGVQIVGLVTRA